MLRDVPFGSFLVWVCCYWSPVYRNSIRSHLEGIWIYSLSSNLLSIYVSHALRFGWSAANRIMAGTSSRRVFFPLSLWRIVWFKIQLVSDSLLNFSFCWFLNEKFIKFPINSNAKSGENPVPGALTWKINLI